MHDPIEAPLAGSEELASNLRQQVRRLNLLLAGALAAFLILSGSLNIYLLRQVSYARKDAAVLRPQVAQLSADYQRLSEPLIKSMVTKFQEYAKTQADFVPILAKYNLAPAAAPTTPSLTTPTGAK